VELSHVPASAPASTSDAPRDRAAVALAVHQEITNALAGLRGQTQLLLRGPAANDPATRDRLEAIIRESDRIERTIVRLRALEVADERAAAAHR
jgi:nitrogen-specific signal transduction histidine kinase